MPQLSHLRQRISQTRRVPAMVRRARVFDERLRFVRNEVRPAPSTAAYTIRSTELSALYRHHSGDMGALADIFIEAEYTLPPPIAAFLEGLSTPRILDLGGHVGYFALFAFKSLPRAQVVSFEPDPANADVLERCIALNRLADRWDLRRACAAAASGPVRFAAVASPGSHIESSDANADTIQVPGVDVLPLLVDFDLVKLDVEGGEWDILHDPRLAECSPPALALEYHARGSRTGAPGAEARAVMEAVGYRLIRVHDKQHGMGTLWGYKPEIA